MSELLIQEFKNLEKKIDENLTVRKEIRDKLNKLCVDMTTMQGDYYGDKDKQKVGTHKMTIDHQGYFMKMSGAMLLITSLMAWMKITK